MTLLSLEGVSKGLNDRVLFRDVTLALGEGERVGLLGANGSGKSTLVRVLAGLEPPDEGSRVVRRGLRLGYLEQDPALEGELTVREAARSGLGERARVVRELEHVHAELAEAEARAAERLLALQAGLEEELERLGGYDVEHRLEATLHALGLEDFDARCGTLSGGERRRVALAQLLLGGPELLLLDEPTNHLDAFVTDWLEDWFLEHRTPLLVVTHDRYFLDRVVDRIVELDRGQLVAYEGGYRGYLEQRAARLERERKAQSARLNLLRRETAWVRRGAPARTTKAKARVRRHAELVDAAPTELAAELVYEFPPGPRLGSRVLAARGVSKRFGERVVVPRLDLELEAGARLGVVGPNGAGKTTLLRLLLGELEPDAGAVEVGETVKFMGIDQLRREIDPAATVRAALAGNQAVLQVGGRSVRVESFLDRWGFPSRTHDTPLAKLSGGERARLLLARLMSEDGNVLFLDEPTNDLDLPTLRALEEALLAFPGAAVIVSHDRWFLDRVATRVLHLDGEGGARLHHGDLSGLLGLLAEERAAREKPAAPRPAKAANAPAAAESESRKLAPWEQRELDELEGRIAELEERAGELDTALSDPALYTGPRGVAEDLRRERAALQAGLDAAFARWEELASRA